MNNKFLKTLRRYCEFHGMDFKICKGMFKNMDQATKQKYKLEVEEFVATRYKVERQLMNNDSVTLPVPLATPVQE